jgi:hypothetical protein
VDQKSCHLYRGCYTKAKKNNVGFEYHAS